MVKITKNKRYEYGKLKIGARHLNKWPSLLSDFISNFKPPACNFVRGLTCQIHKAEWNQPCDQIMQVSSTGWACFHNQLWSCDLYLCVWSHLNSDPTSVYLRTQPQPNKHLTSTMFSHLLASSLYFFLIKPHVTIPSCPPIVNHAVSVQLYCVLVCSFVPLTTPLLPYC